ncbi:aminoglycoside 6'-acetyltransferase [Lysobacter sp. Root494]|nr:aminoglycoside 6'-acetyltransferase [Lysobacter sp. Root494]
MTSRWQVRRAAEADVGAWAELRAALWPEDDAASHAVELRRVLAQPCGTIGFLAIDADGRACGFAEAALRRDYVNGTGSSPVGFLEGWYVVPEARGRGAGRALVAAVEQWTREQGCAELASDVLLDNQPGHRAHVACGFEETERVVYFRKHLSG